MYFYLNFIVSIIVLGCGYFIVDFKLNILKINVVIVFLILEDLIV